MANQTPIYPIYHFSVHLSQCFSDSYLFLMSKYVFLCSLFYIGLFFFDQLRNKSIVQLIEVWSTLLHTNKLLLMKTVPVNLKIDKKTLNILKIGSHILSLRYSSVKNNFSYLTTTWEALEGMETKKKARPKRSVSPCLVVPYVIVPLKTTAKKKMSPKWPELVKSSKI